MANSGMQHLRGALDLQASRILQYDFFLGLAGGVTCIVLAVNNPAALMRGLGVAAGFIGVIVGAVLAGGAFLAAFMDQSFLRKLAAISRDPIRYLRPFLFTAALGVPSMLGVLVLSACTEHTNKWVLGSVGGVTGFLTIWMTFSLWSCLAMMVQFVGLKVDAAQVAEIEVGADAPPLGASSH